jgi:hypothetical protein
LPARRSARTPSSSTVHADSSTQDPDTRKGKAARNTRKIGTLQLQPPTQNPVTATACKINADRPPASNIPDSPAADSSTPRDTNTDATADAPQVATHKNTHSTTTDLDIVQPQDLNTTAAPQAQEAVNTATNAAADIDITILQVRCLQPQKRRRHHHQSPPKATPSPSPSSTHPHASAAQIRPQHRLQPVQQLKSHLWSDIHAKSPGLSRALPEY